MTNIRGSYQTCDTDYTEYVSAQHNNGYPEHTRQTSHIVNVMEPNMRTRADLLEFGQTLKSKVKGFVRHDDGSRPDVIGGIDTTNDFLMILRFNAQLHNLKGNGNL